MATNLPLVVSFNTRLPQVTDGSSKITSIKETLPPDTTVMAVSLDAFIDRSEAIFSEDYVYFVSSKDCVLFIQAPLANTTISLRDAKGAPLFTTNLAFYQPAGLIEKNKFYILGSKCNGPVPQGTSFGKCYFTTSEKVNVDEVIPGGLQVALPVNPNVTTVIDPVTGYITFTFTNYPLVEGTGVDLCWGPNPAIGNLSAVITITNGGDFFEPKYTYAYNTGQIVMWGLNPLATGNFTGVIVCMTGGKDTPTDCIPMSFQGSWQNT